MKKTLYLITTLLLLVSAQVSSQKLVPKDLFSLAKINTVLTDLSKNQQKALGNALTLRDEGFKAAKNSKERKNSHKKYYESLLEILSETQGKKLFEGLINLEQIKTQSKKEAARKFKLFPLAYGKKLTKKLIEFNIKLSVVGYQYAYDYEQMSVEKQLMKSDKHLFFKEENIKTKKASYTNSKIKEVTPSLSPKQMALLRDYHFYIDLKNEDYKEELLKISETPKFKTSLEKIAKGETAKKTRFNNSFFKKQDSIVKQQVLLKTSKKILAKIQQNVKKLKPITLGVFDIELGKITKEITTVKNQKNTKKESKKANLLSKKMQHSCANLTAVQLSLFKEYHTYIDLENTQDKKEQLKKINADSNFIKSLEIIAQCETDKKTTFKNPFFKKQDSLVKQQVIAKVEKKITAKIKENVAGQKPITFAITEIQLGKITKEVLETQKQKSKNNKAQKAKNSFVKKAKKAGLDKAKIEEVLALINTRNSALETLKKSKNKEEDLFAISEASPEKSAKEIKIEFSQKLIKILNYKEFRVIIGDDFVKKSKNQAQKEVKTLVGDKELNEEQSKDLFNLVYGYYFNQNITKAYYNHNKQLLKQKLGVLTYRFEKSYLKLAKEQGIETGGHKKIDNRTFQWN